MIAFYELTIQVLSHELLAAVGGVVLFLYLIAEWRYKSRRHALAASFIFLWVAFDALAYLGVLNDLSGVAMSRYARLFMYVVVSIIAYKDLS